MEPKRLHSGAVLENGAILEDGAVFSLIILFRWHQNSAMGGAELRTMKRLVLSV